MVIVFGPNNGEGDVRFVIENGVYPFRLTTTVETASYDYSSFGKEYFLAHLTQNVPPPPFEWPE